MMERHYKDSGIEWIGRIPEGWKTCQLKRLLAFKNGQDYKHVESDIGFPVYGSGGAFMRASQYLYDGEAVLFGRKGTIDRPIYVNEKFWTVDTMYYAIPLKHGNCKYLYYLATLLPFNKYQTSTALPSMTQTILGDMRVTSPPLPEQQRIASYLDKKCGEIDALIALQEKMIAQLTEYKQAVITEAVTKGLEPNAKLVPSGIEWIGDMPEGWKIVQIKRYLTFQNGQDYKEIETSEKDGFPVYGSGGIFAYASQFMYAGESVLFGRKGTVNRPLYVNCKFWTVDTMYYTIPQKEVCCKFLYYVATTLPYEKYSTSTALPSMTQTILGNMKIAFPPLSEQHFISSYLNTKCSEIDTLIALKRQKIESLNAYKKSVIYEAVTGKTIIE